MFRSATPPTSLRLPLPPPLHSRSGAMHLRCAGRAFLMRFRDLMETHKKDLAAPRVARARQDGHRRRRLDHTRYRSGRNHSLYRCSSFAQGRIQRQRRHGGGHLLDASARRCLCWHQPIQLPGDGADVDVSRRARMRQHIHPEAVRAGPDDELCAWRSSSTTRGFRMACSMSSMATRSVVDAILAHPDVKAVSFVGSTPIARYIYETGTRNGKRVQALGGAKNHAIVHARRRSRVCRRGVDWCSVWLGWRALHGSVGSRRGRRCGRSALSRNWRGARTARQGRGPAIASNPTWGRSLPVPRAIASGRAFIDRGIAEGATLVVDGRRPSGGGA